MRQKVMAHAVAMAIGTTLSVTGFSNTALAQSNTLPALEQARVGDVEPQRVEVTGSSIKRINAETASPVQIIDRKQIENMGAATLQQVLNNLPANMPALQDFRSMFTGTDGASQANLRGLGAGATLILLNGRRLSFYGAPDGFQTQFVNIDTIPAAAIDRMEVLTDGASAIYGSDAIAGVINVITKKAYNGFEISGNTQHSTRIKAMGEHEASALFGFGDLVTQGFNIYGSLNLYKRDPIFQKDTLTKRPKGFYIDNPDFIDSFDIDKGSKYGILNPGTYSVFDQDNNRSRMAAPGCQNIVTSGTDSRCAVNTLSDNLADVPKSSRATLFLNGTYKFGPNLEAFSQINYTHINLNSPNGNPSFNSGRVNTWFARNTGTTLNTFEVPYLSPTNVYNKLSPELREKMGGAAGLNYMLFDAPGHLSQKNIDDSYRAMAGIRGSWGEWDFESALSVAGSHSTLFQTINRSVEGFKKAFGPFTVDPVTKRTYINDNPAYQFGVISEKNAALLREAFPTFDIQSWTKLSTWDGKMEGSIAKLPAGEVRAAFGASLMREEFFTPGNAKAAAGDITQQGGSWFKGERSVGAVFGEAVIPVTKKLEIDAAVRLDKYPNFAANLAPKIGAKYIALPELLLRGTYSEGFRAPNLAESGNGGVFAQTALTDSVRCAETDAIANVLQASKSASDRELGAQLYNSNCDTVVGGLTPPNKNLKPERAKISTVGFVFQPIKNFNISVDYFFAYRRNEIVREDFTQLFDKAVEKYGPALIGAPNATRLAISDIDRGNVAAVTAMCQDLANAEACASGIPQYTVGNLAGLVNSYSNRGRTLVDGFDLDAQARFSLDSMGKLNLGANATIMNRSTYNGDNGDGWSGNYIGLHNNPKVSATFNADWNYGNLVTSLFVNYTGKRQWKDYPGDENYTAQACADRAGALTAAQCVAGAPSYTTVNLAFNWTPVKNLRLGLNVKNLFAKQPYYDPNGWEGYDHRFDILGRVFNLSASYKF